MAITQWFYSEDGRQRGPVSEEDIAAQFRNGRPLTTLVWSQGMAEWTSASEVPAFAPPGSVPLPVPGAVPGAATEPAKSVRKAAGDPWSTPELVAVAQYQKYIQWLVLANVVAMFIPFGTFATAVIGIYFIFKLAAALRSTAAWLYVVAAFVPLVGLLTLLHLVVSATKILRAHGIRVGIMGAKMADFDRMP
ncbi:MAG: DUF4339 domain-containing protein [bacterium]